MLAHDPISPTSAAQARPISLDAGVLAENTMRDLSLQKELFDLYFGQSSVYLQQLHDALPNKDRGGWSAAAHSLKGTARTLGLMWVAAATGTAEVSAPCERQLREIEDALVDARSAAAAYVANSARAA